MILGRPMVSLYFVRHGETDWNVEARLQGQQDVPLNAVGRAQAEEAGRRLAERHAAMLRDDLPDRVPAATPARPAALAAAGDGSRA